MTILIITLVIIYILSVLKARNWIKKAYSKGGRWEILTPNLADMAFTYLPFYNTVYGIRSFFTSPYESKRGRFSYNKHFNIKKH